LAWEGRALADYLDFVNLWQADDREIMAFLDQNGPLGFEVFNAWEFSDHKAKDVIARDRWLQGLTNVPVSGLELAIDNLNYYREENPLNVRREAAFLRSSLLQYRLIMNYRQSHDAVKFLEGMGKDFLEGLLTTEEDSVGFEQWKKQLYSNKDEAKEAAEWLIAWLEPSLIKTFKAALAVTTLTLKQEKVVYALDYIPACPIAGFWFQGIRDIIIEKQTPVICDRCGKMFIAARSWAKSCFICSKAAKARRNRERKAVAAGRPLRPHPGRPRKFDQNFDQN